jgi:exopolysaccharide biosynthesis polyprenyl glycosylphosphotransferase
MVASHFVGTEPRIARQRNSYPAVTLPEAVPVRGRTVPVSRRISPPSHLRYIGRTAFGVDLVVIALCTAAAVAGRNLALPTPDATLGQRVAVAAPAIILGWLVLIGLFGGYRLGTFGAGTDEYKTVVNGSLAAGALVGVSCFLTHSDMSRGFFLIAFATGTPLLVAGRFALRVLLHRARRAGLLQHRVLLAGAEGHVDEIASVLDRESWLGYDLVGAAIPAAAGRTETASRIPVLGDTRAIANLAREASADVVFIAGGAFDSALDIRRLAWELEYDDVKVVIAPSVTDVSRERISVRPVGGLPLINLEKPRAQGAVRSAKRMFDLVTALVLVLLTLPLMLVAAVAVRRFDGGPVLFRQERVGRDGTTFPLWKFRTMVTDAESQHARLQAAQGFSGAMFKMATDPRVTRPGAWLRRYSIDELPQLFNVLLGHMSLVGPRPPLAREVEHYDNDMTRRLRVRPGMTGLWQVSGRSDLSWSEAIRLDLYYVDNWSMIQDLAILVRTIGAVFSSRGAY